MKTPENAGTKPEGTASEDTLAQLIYPILAAVRIKGEIPPTEEAWNLTNALLTRAPRAESMTENQAYAERDMAESRAEAAEAERDDWKRKAESEYDNVVVISKHWRETMAERDRLKAIAKVSDAGYRKLMEDACNLREENEALRKALPELPRGNPQRLSARFIEGYNHARFLLLRTSSKGETK